MTDLLPRYLYNSQGGLVSWANLLPGIAPLLPGADQQKIPNQRVTKNAVGKWPLFAPQHLCDLAHDDSAWSRWETYVGTPCEKLKTLRDRVKVLQVVWCGHPKAQGVPLRLFPLSLDLLESISKALNECRDDDSIVLKKKLRVQGARIVAALVLHGLIEYMNKMKTKAIKKEMLERLGAALNGIPFEEIYKELFDHAVECLHNRKKVDGNWRRRLGRALDQPETVSTDEELDQLGKASAQQAYQRLQEGGNLPQELTWKTEAPSWAQVNELKPCSFAEGKGAIVGAQGQRRSQEDGAWVGSLKVERAAGLYDVPLLFLGDGHRGRGAMDFFMQEMEESLSESLGEMEEWSKPEIYNTGMRTLHTLRARWEGKDSKDASGFVGVLGLLIDENLHLFSWGDVTAVLAGPKTLCNLLPWDTVDNQEMNDIDSPSAKLWRKVTASGGRLGCFPGQERNRLLVTRPEGTFGLNTMNTFGDCDVPGILFQPHYTYLPATMLPGNKLCCVTDGVGEKVSPWQMGQYLQQSGREPSEEGASLIQWAYQQVNLGKKEDCADNATVVIVHYPEKM